MATDERVPPPVLCGPRLVLRPGDASDASALRRVFTAPEVTRWWPMDDLAEADRLLDSTDPKLLVWLIERDDHVVGVIQAWEENDPQYRHAGIDLALHPDAQGQGLGPEAIRLVARHLLDDRGHHRLTVDPNAANERAIRAYRKVGFQPVGVLRQVEWNARVGAWADGLLMDLLREELADDPAPDNGAVGG